LLLPANSGVISVNVTEQMESVFVAKHSRGCKIESPATSCLKKVTTKCLGLLHIAAVTICRFQILNDNAEFYSLSLVECLTFGQLPISSDS
jgi:hypothetical protein